MGREPARWSGLDIAILHDGKAAMLGHEGEEAHLDVFATVEGVERALLQLGHHPRRVGLENGARGALRQFIEKPPDVVFHFAETAGGETAGEGWVAAALNLLGLPHTSASPEALLLCRDKFKAKLVLREGGVPVSEHAISNDGLLPSALPQSPWIAKPTLEDGSIGIGADAVTSERERLATRVRLLYDTFRQPVIIESYIEGREFYAATVHGEPLPVSEVDFSGFPEDAPRIVGYEAKWRPDSAYYRHTNTVCPARIAPEIAERIQETSRTAMEALGVQGYCRVDFRMDGAGRLFVLEVNPNPDFAPDAGLARMAEAAGWGYTGLVDRILDHALRARRTTGT